MCVAALGVIVLLLPDEVACTGCATSGSPSTFRSVTVIVATSVPTRYAAGSR